jgi:protocatechuate 3,4-dioxygenase beta subunit
MPQRAGVPILIVLAAIGAAGQSGGATLNGHITDWQGCPLKGAQITVRGPDGRSATTVADQNGTYELRKLTPGPTRISAELRGFQSAVLQTSLLAGTNLWDAGLDLGRITDPPKYNVSGAVKDVGGGPIGGATVSLWSVFSGTQLKQLRSDSAGRYRFEWIDPGQYVVVAASTNHTADSQVVVIDRAEEGSATVNFELKRRAYCRD